MSSHITAFLRFLLRLLPLSIRRFIVRVISSLPLWLARFFLNIGTRPVGDERNWIHKIEQKAWKGVWIVPNQISLKQAEDAALISDLVVLYAHGGGYCIGHSTMYMETFQLIINHLRSEHNIRASILSLEYSLSPEHVWPKACDEAMEAYQYLTDTMGIPSSKIIFAGDSAGGNLAATMLLTIKSQKHLSQPAGAALLSPWVDLASNKSSSATGQDDYLNRVKVSSYVRHYISDYSSLSEASRLSMIQNPLISPLYGNFSGTCPIFIAYGEKELFRTSIENFKLNLEKDGVDVTTLRGTNALHIWLVYSEVASSKEAFEKDCKIFIDWMASVANGSSKNADNSYQSIDVIDKENSNS